jgi:hypothetical protein
VLQPKAGIITAANRRPTQRARAEALVDYRFKKKRVIHHLFCGQCGVGSFSQRIAPSGKEMEAVNVRCLDGVDLSALTLTLVDGKKW